MASTQLTTPLPAQDLSASRRAAALVALTLPVLLISVDNTVLGFAVPALSEALEPTSAQLLWIVDVYSFVLSGLLVTMGNLGDRIGRRRLLLLGAACFSAASAAAAFAPNANTLIVARAALGFAGATLMPSTLSLIRNIFVDPVQRQFAVAVWSAMFAVGGALGPIVGGLLLEHFWWGSVFLIGVPVTCALIVLGPLLLPESRDPDPGPFDLRSSGLSMLTMFPAVYAMKHVAEHGWTWTPLGAITISSIAGALFLRRQRILESPMIDVSLFSVRRFRSAIAANLAACFGFAGTMFFITQYLQLVVGMSPVRSGLQLLPAVAVSIVFTLLAPEIARRVGAFTTVAGGLTVAAVGFLLLAQVDATGSVPTATVAVAVLSGGVGVAMTVAVDAIVSVIPPAKAGAGASISETAAELGIALGTAVLGSILTAVYRDDLDDSVPGVPADAVDRARETLGAATQTAAELGDTAGRILRDTANAAFTNGVRIGALVAAFVLTTIGWWTARSARARAR
ncbi:MAG TPA: MFS transporter [Acidimicrobiales bacterium]